MYLELREMLPGRGSCFKQLCIRRSHRSFWEGNGPCRPRHWLMEVQKAGPALGTGWRIMVAWVHVVPLDLMTQAGCPEKMDMRMSECHL